MSQDEIQAVVTPGETKQLVVVLLHGFGAPGTDLVPLASALDAPAGTRFAFPAAPLALPPMWGDARAWWMIDMASREQDIASGRGIDLSRDQPPGLPKVHSAMVTFIEQLRDELQPSHLVLGGFSQGAMLAMDVALRSELKIDGLLQLSGTQLCEQDWLPRMKGIEGMPMFMSHGRQDPILPFAGACTLRDRLKEAGADLQWCEFEGGHEIPPASLAGASKLLKRFG